MDFGKLLSFPFPHLSSPQCSAADKGSDRRWGYTTAVQLLIEWYKVLPPSRLLYACDAGGENAGSLADALLQLADGMQDCEHLRYMLASTTFCASAGHTSQGSSQGASPWIQTGAGRGLHILGVEGFGCSERLSKLRTYISFPRISDPCST